MIMIKKSYVINLFAELVSDVCTVVMSEVVKVTVLSQ